MKTLMNPSLAVAILCCISSCTTNKTTLIGSISENVPYVLLSNPQIEVCHGAFLDTIFLDKKHQFKVKLDLQEDRFFIMRLPILNETYTIPIQCGNSYSVTYNKAKGFDTHGPNEEGIRLFQRLQGMGVISGEYFSDESLSIEVINEQMKREELDQFRQLLNQQKISSGFYQLMDLDRTCYYAHKTAYDYSIIAMKAFSNKEQAVDTIRLKKALAAIQKTYEQYRPNDTQWMKSPSWNMFAYFTYIKVAKQFLENRITQANASELFSGSKIPFWIEQIKGSFTGNTLEAVMALFLDEFKDIDYEVNSINTYINASQLFLESFPQSPYLPYFQKEIEQNIAAYQATGFGPDVHFVEDGDIQTFKDLLTQFRGKKLYIDIWTITCGPCRKEFAYKEQLEPILQRNNTIALYIMLGVSEEQKTKYKQTWESLIRKYDLKGYHYWANQPFIDDLEQLLNSKSSSTSTIPVPRYMLIDKQGNIVDKHFKRPSELIKDPSIQF